MNKINLLLVEDDDDHARLVQRSLDRHPATFKVVRARDGVQALKHLQNSELAVSDRTNLILMDLKLPRKGGLEVLEEIRKNPVLTRLPVVILTTSSADIDRAKAYDHHANSYLLKPIEFTQFRSVIDQFANYWGDWNQNPPTELVAESIDEPS